MNNSRGTTTYNVHPPDGGYFHSGSNNSNMEEISEEEKRGPLYKNKTKLQLGIGRLIHQHRYNRFSL